jgi:hypothetical protein
VVSGRGVRYLISGVILAILPGCATARHGSTAATELPRASARATEADLLRAGGEGVTGVWEGVSIANCRGLGISNPGRCAAMQNITLTMFQQGIQVTGYYTCAYGNQNCRNLNEHGVIRNGSMKGKRLMMRVMLEDGSMCFFTAIPDGNLLDGGYECLQGAGLVEQGHFRTERSY